MLSQTDSVVLIKRCWVGPTSTKFAIGNNGPTAWASLTLSIPVAATGWAATTGVEYHLITLWVRKPPIGILENAQRKKLIWSLIIQIPVAQYDWGGSKLPIWYAATIVHNKPAQPKKSVAQTWFKSAYQCWNSEVVLWLGAGAWTRSLNNKPLPHFQGNWLKSNHCLWLAKAAIWTLKIFSWLNGTSSNYSEKIQKSRKNSKQTLKWKISKNVNGLLIFLSEFLLNFSEFFWMEELFRVFRGGFLFLVKQWVEFGQDWPVHCPNRSGTVLRQRPPRSTGDGLQGVSQRPPRSSVVRTHKK